MEERDSIAWAPELDAMSAAPDHHRILLENERVRVLDSVVLPGEGTPLHTHRWPAVLQIVGVSDFTRHDADGNVVFDSRQGDGEISPGQTLSSPPLAPHYVRNIGSGEIRVISVEIKD